MKTPRIPFSRVAALIFLAPLSLLAACGSGAGSGAGTGGAATTSTGGNGSGGAVGAGGATTASGGNVGTSTGGATTGGNSGSGGVSGTGGRATTGGGSGTAGGGAGGAPRTGGATGSGGATGTGGVTGTGGTARTGGASGGGTTGTGGSAGGSSGAFTLTSTGWMNMAGCASNMAASCATLPKELTRTGGGVGVSPDLSWTGVPAGTKSFAVVLQDLSGNSTHWVLWNIPGTATALAAHVDGSTATPAVPAGSQQCSKDPATGAEGYYGPGACGNVYEFMLYALSVPTFSPTMATVETQVRTQLQALGTTILGTASLRGRTFAPNCP